MVVFRGRFAPFNLISLPLVFDRLCRCWRDFCEKHRMCTVGICVRSCERGKSGQDLNLPLQHLASPTVTRLFILPSVLVSGAKSQRVIASVTYSVFMLHKKCPFFVGMWLLCLLVGQHTDSFTEMLPLKWRHTLCIFVCIYLFFYLCLYRVQGT